MESKNNNLFTGSINKVLWNATVIHEKRLGVLDEHIEKLLKNNNQDNGDYKKNLELLNKKIDNLESFRKEFKEYKNEIKNIKDTLSLQDSSDLNEKLEELNNNKLSNIIFMNKK